MSGMSSRRSRSGGSEIPATLSRKKRSRRNFPSSTMRARSRFVAATIADVDLAGPLAADAADLALLQHAQQLALHAGRHLADLVEEQRAAVGDLEQAARVVLGAGEGAARVAEQRRFEQRLRDRGAVFADERLRPLRGPLKWRARATSSLPVPLSPWITTGSVVSVIRSISRNSSSMRGVRPMMLR